MDSFYLMFLLIGNFQYRVYNECMISIQEKQILNPAYVPGSNPEYEPWLIILTGRLKNSPNNVGYFFLGKLINIFIIALSAAFYRPGF